jgi:hypothetical protein
VIVIVALAAPRCAQNSSFTPGKYSESICLSRAMPFHERDWYPHVAPDIWRARIFTSEEEPPFIRRQLQMTSVSCIPNKLVMAPKDVFCTPNIFVETKEHSSFRDTAVVAVVGFLAWAFILYTPKLWRGVRSFVNRILRAPL